MSVPETVVCLWSWDERELAWKMLHAYIGDDGLEPLRKSAINGPEDWLLKYQEDDRGPEAVKGRAVTFWSLLSGVRIYRINVPVNPKWLSPDFFDCLRPESQFRFFAGGSALLFETEKMAFDLLSGKMEPTS